MHLDFHLQSIKVEYGLNRIQRARLPGADFIKHGIGDCRDETGRDFDTLDLFQMASNLALRHAARVKRDDLFIEAIKARLILLDELRFKLRVAIRGTAICSWPRLPRKVFGVVPLRELPEWPVRVACFW
jgi:hypothetical protein